MMRIIGTDKIDAFCRKRAAARRHFDRWLQAAKNATWRNWADVRQSYARASKAGLCVLFDVQGGSFRMITKIDFDFETVSILYVLTHPEYDQGKWKDECECD
jgi:mRNA interferase HigB